MSDPDMTPSPAPAAAPPAPPRTRGWIRILLAVSLALNLAVAGLAVGAFVKNGGPPPRHDERDMGLGPLGDALSREDRRALRKEFLARFPELKIGRAALQADFAALMAALRADPFDPVALDAAVQVISDRNTERLATIRDIISDYLKSLTPEARVAFADRLEKALSRNGKPRDEDQAKD